MAAEAKLEELPPFKCPELPNDTLTDLINKSETIALRNKFLVNYEPKPQILIENEMKYSVCLAENLAKKPDNNINKNKAKDKDKDDKPKKAFDPFAGPFIAGAHVCDLGEKNEYRLILNKFPVLPHHVLIISSEWVQQTNLLTKSDLDITWKVFQSLLLNKENKNTLIFMNSGISSGATQMHRHLHLIPNCGDVLLLNDIVYSLTGNKDEENKQNDDSVKTFDGYSFLHGIKLLDDHVNGDILNKYYKEIVESIKNRMNMNDKIDNDYLTEDRFSYNLLITKDIMIIIARKDGSYQGKLDDDSILKFAINALPFAGLIFCNSHNHKKSFDKVGAAQMIKSCTFAL